MGINLLLMMLLVGVVPMGVILLLPKNKGFFHKRIVKGFGLGVYSALIIILLKEAFEHSAPIFGVTGLVVGFLISLAIGFYYKEFHHHHEPEMHHTHNKGSSMKILVSDFFHNIVDGIAIIAGFAAGGIGGVVALVGVLGHQVIQQSGQQILLVEEGVKPKRAILISFLVSLSVFIALFLKGGEALETILMSFSAGVILFTILKDIKETKWTKSFIFGFVIGFVILFSELILFPHE